jgi:hypothetical protein
VHGDILAIVLVLLAVRFITVGVSAVAAYITVIVAITIIISITVAVAIMVAVASVRAAASSAGGIEAPRGGAGGCRSFVRVLAQLSPSGL